MKYEDFVLERDTKDLYPRLDFVIAKYNPVKYDAKGVYSDNYEWTCIGEAVRKGLVEDYMTKENSYINFFKSVLTIKDCQHLVVHIWSGFNDAREVSTWLDTAVLLKKYRHLKDCSVVSIQTACDLLRLSLRSVIDCSLVNMAHGIEYMVGYEYYLHMRCRDVDYRTLEHLAESFGLFLNPRGNVSTKDIKYDKLLSWLQVARPGDMINPTVFKKGLSGNYLYETLFFSDTILNNNKPRLKAAIVLSFSKAFKQSILSWEDIAPYKDQVKLLIFQFGKKVRIGDETILIGNYPMDWRAYRTMNNVHFVYL